MGKEAIKMELEKRALPEVLRLADGTAVNTCLLYTSQKLTYFTMLITVRSM